MKYVAISNLDNEVISKLKDISNKLPFTIDIVQNEKSNKHTVTIEGEWEVISPYYSNSITNIINNILKLHPMNGIDYILETTIDNSPTSFEEEVFDNHYSADYIEYIKVPISIISSEGNDMKLGEIVRKIYNQYEK